MTGRQPIFKGCTRPPMLWGVPLFPMVITFGVLILLAAWFNLLILLAGIPLYLALRMVVAHDDQQFRLLGLKFVCRGLGANFNRNQKFWGASAYAPVEFRKRKISEGGNGLNG